VAQLMVRNVDDAVVRELKKRAARRNHSAEQEHREILKQLLLRPSCRSLAEVLAAMPDAGKDADFERPQIDPRTYRLTPHMSLVDTGFSLTARTASIGPERSPSAAGIPGGRGRSRDRDRVAPETGD
jgi:antitoxin FitA